MKKAWMRVLILSFVFLFVARGDVLSHQPPEKEDVKAQGKQEHPVSMMTKSMLERLSNNLHVKNIVGDPIKIGEITVIPIIMIDIGYGGGEGGPPDPAQKGGGFYMSGEARPLGFVVVSKSGTKFVSAGKAPRK